MGCMSAEYNIHILWGVLHMECLAIGTSALLWPCCSELEHAGWGVCARVPICLKQHIRAWKT